MVRLRASQADLEVIADSMRDGRPLPEGRRGGMLIKTIPRVQRPCVPACAPAVSGLHTLQQSAAIDGAPHDPTRTPGSPPCSALLAPLAAQAADDPRPRTVSRVRQRARSRPSPTWRSHAGCRGPQADHGRGPVRGGGDRRAGAGADPRPAHRPEAGNATRLQVQPEYSWNEKDRKRVLLGYLVSRQVQVELRDLEQLGPLLERAVDAGVNQVERPGARLEPAQVARARGHGQGGRGRAAECRDAGPGGRREARPGADPERLGLSAADADVPAAVAMADAAAAPRPRQTYQAGEMKFSASVNAEYDLLVKP